MPCAKGKAFDFPGHSWDTEPKTTAMNDNKMTKAPTVYQLQFDDLVIHVSRKAIKHMYVRIKPPNGQVCVSIPKRADLAFIKRQLEAKMDWIHSRRNLQIAKDKLLTPNLECGGDIAFLGKNLTLIIQPVDRITIQDDCILFPATANIDEAHKLRVINHWYRQQLHARLPDLIAKWEAVVGVRAATFAIRLMKSRWGSCNTRTGRICLNLNLIKKPLACLEYVLVHELVHLHEASHNRRFYDLMNQFMPDWRAHHAILEPGSRLGTNL